MAYYRKHQVEEPRFTVKEIVAAAIIQDEQHPTKDGVPLTTRDILESTPVLPVARAEQMIEEVQQNFTLSMLRGREFSNFNRKLAEIISEPEAKTNSNFGILAYVPSVHRDLVKTNTITEQTCDSRYQGRTGETLNFTARVLNCRYIASYGFYTALLLDDTGNVYSFSPKASLDEGATVTIRGKVKAHKQDKYNNNVETTYLNYVKIQKN